MIPDVLIDDATAKGKRIQTLSLKAHFAAVAALRDDVIRKRSSFNPIAIVYGALKGATLLNNLVKKAGTSTFYNSLQDRIVANFRTDLASVPSLHNTIRNWRHMDRFDQKKFLQHCVELLAAHQSACGIAINPARLRWIDARDMRGAHGRMVYEGSFTDKTLPLKSWIELRSKGEKGINNFADALETTVHEQTHNYQLMLAQAALTGSIKPGHPLYKDGVLFGYSYANGYVSSAASDSAYRAQAIEKDAFRVGHLTRIFARAVKREALHYPPPREEKPVVPPNKSDHTPG